MSHLRDRISPSPGNHSASTTLDHPFPTPKVITILSPPSPSPPQSTSTVNLKTNWSFKFRKIMWLVLSKTKRSLDVIQMSSRGLESIFCNKVQWVTWRCSRLMARDTIILRPSPTSRPRPQLNPTKVIVVASRVLQIFRRARGLFSASWITIIVKTTLDSFPATSGRLRPMISLPCYQKKFPVKLTKKLRLQKLIYPFRALKIICQFKFSSHLRYRFSQKITSRLK